MESYTRRVTSAGRLTLPKEILEGLGLRGSEYVKVVRLGKVVVVRRLCEDDELLDSIRGKARKSGMTRARLRNLVDEPGRRAWMKRYGRT